MRAGLLYSPETSGLRCGAIFSYEQEDKKQVPRFAENDGQEVKRQVPRCASE
jgi:hypothetical protein